MLMSERRAKRRANELPRGLHTTISKSPRVRSINLAVIPAFRPNARIIRDVAPSPFLSWQTGTELTGALAYTESARLARKLEISVFPANRRKGANPDAVMGQCRAEAAFNWTTSRRQDIRSADPGRRRVDSSGSRID